MVVPVPAAVIYIFFPYRVISFHSVYKIAKTFSTFSQLEKFCALSLWIRMTFKPTFVITFYTIKIISLKSKAMTPSLQAVRFDKRMF